MNPNKAKILVVGWTNCKTIALLKKLDEIKIKLENLAIIICCEDKYEKVI